MPKITDEELETIQVRLCKKDLDVLRTLYRDNVGVNLVIRTIVRSFVRQTEAKATAAIDALPPLDDLMGDVDNLLGGK